MFKRQCNIRHLKGNKMKFLIYIQLMTLELGSVEVLGVKSDICVKICILEQIL